jgi:adenosylcobyric acid synthase
MAKTIMIQGTASSAGKSLMTAGLCRILMQDGYKVAPFKSQNMALNAFVTVDGLEMGRAQVMQAEACGIPPDVRMNPILLKPTSEKGSQVIVNGEVLGNMSALEYFSSKKDLIPEIMNAFESLAAEYDVIVIEGAGSPAEINMKAQDIVNMGMAKLANAPVLLVGDIDRGGVFAALAGTMQLFSEEEKQRVKGTIINKFRGDRAILEPGLKMLEDIIQVPVAGVVPYIPIQLDDEDSLTERFVKSADPSPYVDIAVIRLPRISNFTDFNPFERIDHVSLRYVGSVSELGSPDLILLPGSKNTMSDLVWLRQSGLEAAIMAHADLDLPIMGICGGYQMLSLTLRDPFGVEHGGEMSGLGLLETETVFEVQKVRKQVRGILPEIGGIFAALSGEVYEGYEMHMGITLGNLPVVNRGNVYGTYIHGIFDMGSVAQTIVRALLNSKGLDEMNIKASDSDSFKMVQYDLLADHLRKSLDMELINKIIFEGLPPVPEKAEELKR